MLGFEFLNTLEARSSAQDTVAPEVAFQLGSGARKEDAVPLLRSVAPLTFSAQLFRSHYDAKKKKKSGELRSNEADQSSLYPASWIVWTPRTVYDVVGHQVGAVLTKPFPQQSLPHIHIRHVPPAREPEVV